MFKEFRDAVVVQLAMPLSFTDLANQWTLFRESFEENRRRRPRQLKRVRNALNN